MTSPFFYIKNYDSFQKEIQLDEDTSRHVVQVLRMKPGEKLNLTDGKGHLLSAEVINDNKKHCEVKITDSRFTPHDSRHITIGISLLKNTSRFEWFLEKATEIGVREVIPLICERTEKEKFRFDRMQGICISAMLQSQQVWLPVLHEPSAFNAAIEQLLSDHKFIATCDEAFDRSSLSTLPLINSAAIFIGPEGDFTKDEIELALQHNFTPVTLGERRLRTETAGIVAATILCSR